MDKTRFKRVTELAESTLFGKLIVHKRHREGPFTISDSWNFIK